MSRWKERLATLFLVVAVGLSLLPWVYEARPAQANEPLKICDTVDYDLLDCYGEPKDCGCPIIIIGKE